MKTLGQELEEAFARQARAMEAASELVEALRELEAYMEEHRPFADIEMCLDFPEDRTPEDEELYDLRRNARALLARIDGEEG